MEHTNTPTKELVREWLWRRQLSRAPLPNRDQIRRELGWELVKEERPAASLRMELEEVSEAA